MVQRLYEIVDLNKGERALMAVWNRYKNTQFVEVLKGSRGGKFSAGSVFSQIFPQLPVAPLGPSSEAHG